MKNSTTNFDMGTMDQTFTAKWGWFVALGVILFGMGLFAFGNLLIATSASIFFIGTLMSVGGVLQIVHSFQVKSWSGFFFLLFSGILYSTAGIIAFQNPLLAAATLTLLLSFALIASGIMRIWTGIKFQPQTGWGWTLASGIITFFAGIIFMLGWPVNTLWLLGIILAMDLTFQGVASVALGMKLKEKQNRHTHPFSSPPATVL